jgi:hypothetical protein
VEPNTPLTVKVICVNLNSSLLQNLTFSQLVNPSSQSLSTSGLHQTNCTISKRSLKLETSKFQNFTITERLQDYPEIGNIHIPSHSCNSCGKPKHIRHYTFLAIFRHLWNVPAGQQYQMRNSVIKISLYIFQRF